MPLLCLSLTTYRFKSCFCFTQFFIFLCPYSWTPYLYDFFHSLLSCKAHLHWCLDLEFTNCQSGVGLYVRSSHPVILLLIYIGLFYFLKKSQTLSWPIVKPSLPLCKSSCRNRIPRFISPLFSDSFQAETSSLKGSLLLLLTQWMNEVGLKDNLARTWVILNFISFY